LHLLLTPASDVTLEGAIQLIKGGYSCVFGLEFRGREVWQRRFTDHRIRDAEDFARHNKYIRQNPVKRGLVASTTEYRYCSAYPGFKLDERTSEAKAAIA
jgi:putative transposase